MKKLLTTLFTFSLLINSGLMTSAMADAAGATSTVSTPPASTTTTGEKSFGEQMDGPWGIIIAAGIGTAFSTILYSSADKQEKESKANAEKVQKLIASFKDSYAAYCPNGRETQTDAKCYCYNADGSKNTNRTNSQTCVDLWNKNGYLISGDAANYGLQAYSADVAGCVTVDGQFDENCKCKKLIDSKGANACKKETNISLPSDAFSTALATGGGASDLQKLYANATNGNPGLDLISSASIGAKAIKSKQITDALLTKVGLDKKVPNINPANVEKYANAVLGSKNIADRMNSSSMPMNVSSARSENFAMKNALAEAQKKAGIEITGSGKGLAAAKEKKKPAFDLNLGADSGSSGGGQVQEFAGGNDKNYKFKNSDIVTDNSASIFEIISNRYVQSGLKRLFDDGSDKN